MKKRLVILALVFSFLLGSGCYVTKAARIKDIVGTYKLVTYTNDGKDLITERQIEAYLIVNNSGTSYYVYKQGDNPRTVEEVLVRFVADTEEPSKYAFVEYKLAHQNEYQTLGYANGQLNSNRIQYRHKGPGIFDIEHYYIYTLMDKVSKKTDLSFVESQVGALPPVMDYNRAKYDGVYSYQYDSGVDHLSDEQEAVYANFENPFVYYYVDLDMANFKATVYYMLKSNEVAVVERINFVMENDTLKGLKFLPANDNGDAVLRSSAYNSEVQAFMQLPVKFVIDEVELTFNYEFSKSMRHSFDIEYQMEYAVNYYNEQKAQD